LQSLMYTVALYAAAITAIAGLFAACASPKALPTASPVGATAAQRCTLRFARGQVLVDGAPVTRTAAIERCTQRGDAVVYLDDPALCDEWSAIEAELRRADVHLHVSGTVGDFRLARRIVPSNAAPDDASPTPAPRTCR
jgi:hypothetical protein